jgi:hypothetical protein
VVTAIIAGTAADALVERADLRRIRNSTGAPGRPGDTR